MNNNSIEFKKKYIKYKNKYIFLKNQLYFAHDTKLKQIGGEGDNICIPNADGRFDSFKFCHAATKTGTSVESNAAINLEAANAAAVLTDVVEAYSNVLHAYYNDDSLEIAEGELNAVIEAFDAYKAFEDAFDAYIIAKVKNEVAFDAYKNAYIMLTNTQKAIDERGGIPKQTVGNFSVGNFLLSALISAEKDFTTALEAYKIADEAYIIATKAYIVTTKALEEKIIIITKLGPKHAKALNDKLKTQR